MQVRESPKPQLSRFQMFRFRHGVICSSFDVAKDSNTVKSHSSKKYANHSTPISNIESILQNIGKSGKLFVEKPLHLGAYGLMGISFLASGDHSQNAAFVRLLPSLVRLPNWPLRWVHTICVIPLPQHFSIRLRMDWIASQCHCQPFSSCWGMLILRQRPSTHGSPHTSLLV